MYPLMQVSAGTPGAEYLYDYNGDPSEGGSGKTGWFIDPSTLPGATWSGQESGLTAKQSYATFGSDWGGVEIPGYNPGTPAEAGNATTIGYVPGPLVNLWASGKSPEYMARANSGAANWYEGVEANPFGAADAPAWTKSPGSALYNVNGQWVNSIGMGLPVPLPKEFVAYMDTTSPGWDKDMASFLYSQVGTGTTRGTGFGARAANMQSSMDAMTAFLQRFDDPNAQALAGFYSDSANQQGVADQENARQQASKRRQWAQGLQALSLIAPVFGGAIMAAAGAAAGGAGAAGAAAAPAGMFGTGFSLGSGLADMIAQGALIGAVKGAIVPGGDIGKGALGGALGAAGGAGLEYLGGAVGGMFSAPTGVDMSPYGGADLSGWNEGIGYGGNSFIPGGEMLPIFQRGIDVDQPWLRPSFTGDNFDVAAGPGTEGLMSLAPWANTSPLNLRSPDAGRYLVTGHPTEGMATVVDLETGAIGSMPADQVWSLPGVNQSTPTDVAADALRSSGFDAEAQMLMDTAGMGSLSPDLGALDAEGFANVQAAPDAPASDPEAAPDAPDEEEAAPFDAKKALSLAKKVYEVYKQVADDRGDKGAAAAEGPEREKDQTDAEYTVVLAEYLELPATDLKPDSREYFDFVRAETDRIIREILGDDAEFLDGKTPDEMAEMLAGRREDEMEQLYRALFVRGQLGGLTFEAAGKNPFTSRTEDFEWTRGPVNPGVAGAQRGMFGDTEQLANLRGNEARSFFDSLMGRETDLYGMQAGRDADKLMALFSPDGDTGELRKRTWRDWDRTFREMPRADLGRMLNSIGDERAQAKAIEALMGRGN